MTFFRLKGNEKTISRNHVFFYLKGGFGNQLFQLAKAINFSFVNDTCFSLHTVKGRWDFSLQFMDIVESSCYKPLLISGNLELATGNCLNPNSEIVDKDKCYKEPTFHYSETPSSDFRIFDGYWQSEKHFRDVKSSFANFVKLKLNLNQFPDQNHINVHVRLGDMAGNKQALSFHGIQPEAYFLTALKHFSKGSDIQIVCQDIEEVERFYPNLFKIADKFRSSSRNLDFALLAQSKNLIISHSTFSWWAAYLSSGRVVAPRSWFSDETMKVVSTKDLYLDTWKVI